MKIKNKTRLLTQTSALNCSSFSLSASKCLTGSKLAKCKDSICSKCYAGKGFYPMPSVKAAHKARLQETLDLSSLTSKMLKEIDSDGRDIFRWFDSGDIQSYEMLESIVDIAIARPHVRFWLPTKERSFIAKYLHIWGSFPPNLTVRISSTFINRHQIAWARRHGLVASGVASKDRFASLPKALQCLKPFQGNKCMKCTKCWDKEQMIVIYKLH